MNDNQQRHAWQDSIVTLIISACMIVLNIALTFLLSRFFPTREFEDYLFARRFITTVFPITTLSIGTGLTWILARKIASNPESVKCELKGTVALIVIFNFVVLLLAFILPSDFIQSYIFPLGAAQNFLWKVVFIWLFAYSAYIVLYSYYRGLLDMRSANILNLFMNGVFPIAIFLLLWFLGKLYASFFLFCWAAAYLLCFIPILKNCGNFFDGTLAAIRQVLSSSILYSISRIPAGFLYGFPFFVLPFYMMKHGLDTVYFLSALLVIQTLSFLTDPLAQVFLPRSANWNESNDMKNLKKLTGDFLGLALHCGLIVSAILFAHGKSIARIWFGPGFLESGFCIQILALSIVPVITYPPLRSILDGIEKKPLITHFLAIVSVFTLLIVALLQKIEMLGNLTVSMIVVADYYILFFMILFAILARIGKLNAFALLLHSLIVAGICGTAGFIIERFFGNSGAFLPSLLVILASCLVSCVLNLCWLEWRKPSWWLILKDIFFSSFVHKLFNK